MQTCVRGFSFMPESKLDSSLQYIEDGELERAWKVNRRQRLKEQEQRIWEEFVKEQDIVQKAYSEDPYQFLHELPENCLKELMEVELNKMRKETEEEVVGEVSNQGEGDHPAEKQMMHTVTFAEDNESPDSDMFHIFDDENELNLSGGEEGQPESPSTVRERCSDDTPPAQSQAALSNQFSNNEQSDVAVSVKSSENVSNVIESSIYCARVKDIRLKIGEEMVAVMASLDIQDVMSVEREEVSRRCRRAAEFCARFNRIYMYQLQRQVHNIKRHVSQSLPLAQHTHFQAQMLRIVSLHQNILQAIQVFHKSFSATSCLRECGRALSAIADLVRDVSALCGTVPAPRDFAAAHHLYNDDLLQTCDKLDAAIKEYALRVADFLSSSDIAAGAGASSSVAATASTRSKKSKRTRTFANTGSKTWSSKDTDARLSMYSLDTLRINLHNKPSARTARDYHCYTSGTSKGHASPSVVAVNKTPTDKAPITKRVPRRPLMRAPPPAAPRPRPPRRDADIATMVEAVDTCESSHAMSVVQTPRSRDNTPRMRPPPPPPPPSRPPRQHSPRNCQKTTRGPKQRAGSPRVKSRASPTPTNPTGARNTPTTVRSETPTKTTIAPVTMIQCARKQPENNEKIHGKSPDRSGKNTDRSRNVEQTNDRSGKSTDRSRNDRISSRSKENERIYSARGSKGTEYGNRKGRVDKRGRSCTVDKEDNGNVDVDVIAYSAADNNENYDSDDSNGKVNKDIVYGKVDRPGHIGNPGKEDNTGRELCGVKELTGNDDDYSRRYAREVEEERSERGRDMSHKQQSPARCDVTRLLRQLCSGDPAGLSSERVTGAKNAQLLCVRGASPPRQPSTPQLLRILEETIQKQTPRPIYVKPRNPDRYRLNFNIPETTAGRMFHYRTKFVQHMLTSPLYANSAVGKPWEVIGSVSDKLIDELLTSIAKEMEISHVLRALYTCETN